MKRNSNKEERAAYYLANKEKIKATNERWRKSNPEKIAAKQKRYLLKLNLMNKKATIRTMNAWAVQVKQKDCYTCRDCGSTENLEAHHIYSKSKHPHRILELDNGTTLCEDCHKYEHSTNGVF
jgi:5-methylcytosine-specific restriction endonuclease McrA